MNLASPDRYMCVGEGGKRGPVVGEEKTND